MREPDAAARRKQLVVHHNVARVVLCLVLTLFIFILLELFTIISILLCAIFAFFFFILLELFIIIPLLICTLLTLFDFLAFFLPPICPTSRLRSVLHAYAAEKRMVRNDRRAL